MNKKILNLTLGKGFALNFTSPSYGVLEIELKVTVMGAVRKSARVQIAEEAFMNDDFMIIVLEDLERKLIKL
jgi:hypothetical protein